SGCRPARRALLDLAPWLEFDRVNGPLMGGSVGVGSRFRSGVVTAKLAYGSGPNRWFGGGGYQKVWRRRGRDHRWTVSGFAGRGTDVLDLDRRRQLYYSLSAFLTGDDRSHYLQRDGVRVALEREGAAMKLRLAWRDQIESPRATTATWNLYRTTPAVIENFQASLGRTVEWQALLSGRPVRAPLWVELDGRAAARVAGGDFDYRRLRAVVGADLAIGRMASLLPQLTYGRLDGDLTPQSGFWLGGPRSLRSLPSYGLAGRNTALGRAELISARDVLSTVGVPHPAWLDLQPGLFVASGAVWGEDPFGGPTRRGGGWPGRELWLSEAGASLLYRPGIPDPEGYFRITYARPLGANDDGARLSVSYSIALDQLRGAER
ncbi:MAG: hypothetical protein HOP12_11130, partial [Candidatus Eisenbacteria bacterium]|nr:hypothetical protein [Candidatus Eisenbacteria bacterium]